MMRRWVARAAVVLVLALAGSVTSVHAAGPTPLFRVFLKDGTALVCWGEYAVVGDRLVLTIPIGQGPRTAYEFASIPVLRIDMVKTERYAESVRASQFAASRGKAEYAELSDRLAAQLASIATMADAQERLLTAEHARRQLLDWTETSHGYRAQEVQHLLQMFDSAIIDLRVAAGESRFSINLSGGMMPAAPVKLRTAPTAAETVELAMKAAAASDSEDIRRALLAKAKAVAATIPKSDRATKLKLAVDREIANAVRLEIAYRRLDHDIRGLVASAVDRGDVKGVQALRERVLRTDRLLGRQRPEEVAPLLEWIDRQKDAAAEQRLVLDHWEALRGEIVEYQQGSATLIKTLDSLSPMLKDIGDMTGPPLTSLVMAERQTSAVIAMFSNLLAPEGASVAHSLLGLAIQQADMAVRTRHRAVDTRQLSAAREAADAATDALARLVQAKNALSTALKPPKAIR